MQIRLASNLRSSCSHLPRNGMEGVSRRTGPPLEYACLCFAFSDLSFGVCRHSSTFQVLRSECGCHSLVHVCSSPRFAYMESVADTFLSSFLDLPPASPECFYFVVFALTQVSNVYGFCFLSLFLLVFLLYFFL